MVASAYAAHMARRAAEFGVTITGNVSVDMKKVKARKDLISGESSTGVETSLKNMVNCTVYEGHARFESPHEVSVGETRLRAGPKFSSTWVAAPWCRTFLAWKTFPSSPTAP